MGMVSHVHEYEPHFNSLRGLSCNADHKNLAQLPLTVKLWSQ